MISALVSWNGGGAFVMGALGLTIDGGDYSVSLSIPLAFVCWAAPVIGIFRAQSGLFSRRTDLGEGTVAHPVTIG